MAVHSPWPQSHPRGWGQTGLGMLLVVSNTHFGARSPAFIVGLANNREWHRLDLCSTKSSFVYSFREQKKSPPSDKQGQKHARILSISSTKNQTLSPRPHPRPHTPQCTWLPGENSLLCPAFVYCPGQPEERSRRHKGSLFLSPDKGSFIPPRGLAGVSGELLSGALGCFRPSKTVLGEGLSEKVQNAGEC